MSPGMIFKQRDTDEEMAKPAGPPLQNLSVGSPSQIASEPFKEILPKPCQPTPDTPVAWSRHFNRESTDLHSMVFWLVAH